MKKLGLFLSVVAMIAVILGFSDSGTYETVIIGEQIWMTSNLNVEKFRNGDPIPQAKTKGEWTKANLNKEPAWCYYNNNPYIGKKYGKLYNWYAVNDSRGLAPKGWHVPSDVEWAQLIDYLGGKDVADSKMKSTRRWYDGGNGTNRSGFTGLPSGSRNSFGSFISIGKDGCWWSSTEIDSFDAWCRYLTFYGGGVGRIEDNKGIGFSVRCLRD